MKSKLVPILSAVLTLTLIASACGSDDEGATAPATTAAQVATTAPATTAAPPSLAGTSVTVFGPESSDEEAGAFQDALDVFAAESGIEISYTGTRDASDQINAQAAGGNPPDIFVFPQPGKLADFAREGYLVALPSDVDSAVAEHWSDAWTAFGEVDGVQYGIPTKSDLKSLVWYKPARFEASGYDVPTSWDGLKSLAGTMIANGDTPFCVGIESGPATGWTFTDWVEDLMLRMYSADLYDQWVAGTLPFSSPEVTSVFNEVLDLWNTPGMVFAAGGSIAATPFGDNGQPLVDDDCMMHRQASFYAAFIPEGTAFADGSADAIDTFYFPSVKGDRPVLGAGTLVGAFRDAPEVWAVMTYLGSSEYAEVRQVSQTKRKGGGLSGFLSGAQHQDPNVYHPLEQSFLDILVTADVVRFDASDLMPAAVGAGTFWTEGTAVVNGDKTVAEATADIDASWPGREAAAEAASLAGTSVTVFGPESSDEEAGAFQDALDVFAAESGIEISYTGTRDASDQINAQAAGGNPPDIFVFPQPGKLADFAREGYLVALPSDVDSAVAEHWSDAWTAFGEVDGVQYGIPTKSDLKSLVWYKPARFEASGYDVPTSWDGLKSLAGTMIANGDTPFCVGIESGPATGWTFTDWVEDLMLRMYSADLYDQWVAGTLPFSSPEVTSVFNEVLDLWNTPGMVFAAGGSIAATPFGDNGQPLVDDDCMMHRQASFYAAFIPEGTAFADGSADAIDTFYFPSVKGDRPVLGAGTLVGAFRDAPEVWAVMTYLGSSEYAEVRQVSQTKRKGGGLSGFLSGAQHQDPNVYHPLEQSFLDILVTADVVRFDASDLMPAAVGAGTFWTEGTAVVNGDKTVAEATADIDASWPAG